MTVHFSKQSSINPFYTPRDKSFARTSRKVYALLPEAPETGSPVPHLTSLYHLDENSSFGDRRYPGNCSGSLIRDLLIFFRPRKVFDPMTGTGTCADVCSALSVSCISKDIRDGFDATDSRNFKVLREDAPFDFVWAHPPY